jgi:hypothetical protein
MAGIVSGAGGRSNRCTDTAPESGAESCTDPQAIG